MNMKKIKLKHTVIVEGKYDKIKLGNIVDATILTTDGFRIYSNREKQALIRNIAAKTGIIIFTDSDAAGRRIRSFIKNIIGGSDDPNGIINIYLPQITGKEKRKSAPSKENLLGVEGADNQIIAELFERFKINVPESELGIRKITKIDFYEDGFSGKSGSSEKRGCLCEYLNLPPMSANALLEAVNILSDFEEYKRIASGFDA